MSKMGYGGSEGRDVACVSFNAVGQRFPPLRTATPLLQFCTRARRVHSTTPQPLRTLMHLTLPGWASTPHPAYGNQQCMRWRDGGHALRTSRAAVDPSSTSMPSPPSPGGEEVRPSWQLPVSTCHKRVGPQTHSLRAQLCEIVCAHRPLSELGRPMAHPISTGSPWDRARGRTGGGRRVLAQESHLFCRELVANHSCIAVIVDDRHHLVNVRHPASFGSSPCTPWCIKRIPSAVWNRQNPCKFWGSGRRNFVLRRSSFFAFSRSKMRPTNNLDL